MAGAAEPQKQILISYEQDVPISIIDKAKDVIRAAVRTAL